MRKLIALSIVFMFVLANAAAFAEQAKGEPFPRGVFNCMGKWLSSFGKRADGTSVMDYTTKESTLTPEEVKERRENIGVKSGMERY